MLEQNHLLKPPLVSCCRSGQWWRNFFVSTSFSSFSRKPLGTPSSIWASTHAHPPTKRRLSHSVRFRRLVEYWRRSWTSQDPCRSWRFAFIQKKTQSNSNLHSSHWSWRNGIKPLNLPADNSSRQILSTGAKWFPGKTCSRCRKSSRTLCLTAAQPYSNAHSREFSSFRWSLADPLWEFSRSEPTRFFRASMTQPTIVCSWWISSLNWLNKRASIVSGSVFTLTS
jgi:hypothetical protein